MDDTDLTTPPVFTLTELQPSSLDYMAPWVLFGAFFIIFITSLVLAPRDRQHPDRRKITGSLPFLILSWGGRILAGFLTAGMFLYAIMFQFWTGPVGDIRGWLETQHQVDIHPHHIPALLNQETVTATSTHPADQTRTVTGDIMPETYQLRLEPVGEVTEDGLGDYTLIYDDSGEPYVAGAGPKAGDHRWEHGR